MYSSILLTTIFSTTLDMKCRLDRAIILQLIMIYDGFLKCGLINAYLSSGGKHPVDNEVFMSLASRRGSVYHGASGFHVTRLLFKGAWASITER